MCLPPIRCLTLAALFAMVACGGGGGSSAPPPPPSPPTNSAQVLMNTGFEQTSPLIWQGDTGIIFTNQDATYAAHGGTYFAYLGGYGTVASDQITQDLYIPASAQSAGLTFYMKIVTAEPGSAAVDTCVVAALTTSGATLGTLRTLSNLDAANYKAFTVDLLPFKGQIVRLSFKSLEDAQNQTSFLLDDVVVDITAPSADLSPVIASFSPASGIIGEQAVQVAGKNFFGVSAVSIGGVNAAYVLTDGTALSATVPASAATGSAPISITNALGTGTSSTNFSAVYGTPTIASVNPTQGPVGAAVVIIGTYLGYPGTTVTLNGLAITTFTQSASQITFTLPATATTGNLVISTPGGSVSQVFTVNTATTTLDLFIGKVELTQSTQTLDNSVPIVAGKAGLVRVFVLANQANALSPTVLVTLFNNGLPVAGYPKSTMASTGSVPTSTNEGDLSSSWNLAIPGTDLNTPAGSGYSVTATVDPAGLFPEADKTNNTASVTLGGTTVPVFKTTIFPVVLASGTGAITEGNKAAWVARLAKMYPIAGVDVIVGAPFTGSVSTLAADDSDGHWETLLLDLRTKHQADGASDRYYYGALKVSYASGVAGLGYVPGSPSSSFWVRTAMGWDKSSGYADGGLFPEVFAHETGHNMGRLHSPCGGADSPDPNYPYAGGLIGVWGYDSVLNALHSPATDKDIMGYCTPNWVSDYVYKKILAFRGGTGGFLKGGAEDAPLPKALAVSRECLLVRGFVHGDGRVELRPSFRTQALPSAPVDAGEYTLVGVDPQDRPIFSTPIDLVELGCGPKGHERHFVMALPLDAAVLDSLAELQVLKAGQVLASLRPASAQALIVPATPHLQRLSAEKVQLTWDAAHHPAVMVRDRGTGEVIAILSGGRQAITASSKRIDLVLSDGVSGPTLHLEAAE